MLKRRWGDRGRPLHQLVEAAARTGAPWQADGRSGAAHLANLLDGDVDVALVDSPGAEAREACHGTVYRSASEVGAVDAVGRVGLHRPELVGGINITDLDVAPCLVEPGPDLILEP